MKELHDIEQLTDAFEGAVRQLRPRPAGALVFSAAGGKRLTALQLLHMAGAELSPRIRCIALDAMYHRDCDVHGDVAILAVRRRLELAVERALYH